MLDPLDPKDPLDYSYLTYAWVATLAIWGGVSSFISKVKRGETRWCNVPELAGDLFISGGTGIITFYLCEFSGTPPLLSAVFIAISGHMGTRAIVLFERFVTRRFEAVYPREDKETKNG